MDYQYEIFRIRKWYPEVKFSDRAWSFKQFAVPDEEPFQRVALVGNRICIDAHKITIDQTSFLTRISNVTMGPYLRSPRNFATTLIVCQVASEQ
jgi:hypothetical protein